MVGKVVYSSRSTRVYDGAHMERSRDAQWVRLVGACREERNFVANGRDRARERERASRVAGCGAFEDARASISRGGPANRGEG